MNTTEILDRANRFLARLPVRNPGERSVHLYRKTFRRMVTEPTLRAWRPGISIDTYYVRRAALHWGARKLIENSVKMLKVAESKMDFQALQAAEQNLLDFLDALERPLAEDPPCGSGESPFRSTASRLRQENRLPPRGQGSKRHDIASLPIDWIDQLWTAAVANWTQPTRQNDLDALAVSTLVPVRPVELARHDKNGRSAVRVDLRSDGLLDITIVPAKNHNQIYGTGTTLIRVDPTEAGKSAIYLAARCMASNGGVAIAIRSEDAGRGKLKRLGWAVFGKDVDVTHYLLRHQVISDLKATFGAGALVAAAAGHCTDRTQSKYGWTCSGRKRRGWVAVECARVPRVGNVTRARALAAQRRKKLSRTPD